MRLPTDANERKAIPVYSGFIAYFPLAIAAVAAHSLRSNEQHNPGQPLHWDKAKSQDEKDALCRHLIDGVGATPETDIVEATAVAWRAMANLERTLEKQESQKLAVTNVDLDNRHPYGNTACTLKPNVHQLMRELRTKSDGTAFAAPTIDDEDPSLYRIELSEDSLRWILYDRNDRICYVRPSTDSVDEVLPKYLAGRVGF
jgi:hypothetical protein